MTDGMIIIKDGKNYKMLRHFNSDAYMEGKIGKLFTEAFDSEDVNNAVIDSVSRIPNESNSQECYDYLMEDGEKFYNKNKNKEVDAYYVDYTYLYDLKTRTLKVFYCGKLIFTFKKDQYEYFRVLVKHTDIVWKGLSYDFKTKEYSKDYEKEFKKYMRAGMAPVDILNLAVENQKNIHYVINMGRITDCHRNGYKKEVRFTHSCFESLFFCFYHEYGKWSIYLQLPWIRVPFISWGYNSERSIKKDWIADLDKRWESLKNGLPLYKFYTSIQREFYDTMKDFKDGNISKDECLSKLDEIEKKFNQGIAAFDNVDYSGYKGFFNTKKAKETFTDTLFSAIRNINR